MSAVSMTRLVIKSRRLATGFGSPLLAAFQTSYRAVAPQFHGLLARLAKPSPPPTSLVLRLHRMQVSAWTESR